MSTETNYMTEGIKVINSDGLEEIIQIPYNLNNVLVKEEDIIKILNNYSVKVDKVNHINFFEEAFTHKSYCKKDENNIVIEYEASRLKEILTSQNFSIRSKSINKFCLFVMKNAG
jgi:dsRNA-specific ribonuclease